MKDKGFPIFLAIEAVFLLILYYAFNGESVWSSAVLGFPFIQVGAGLRMLSLSGSVGNGVAILLYVLLCLLPVAALLLFRRKRSLAPEDGLLVLLSLFLFLVFYFMINPGKIPGLLSGEEGSLLLEQSLFSGAAYALMFSYAVIRALRHFMGADREQLQDYLAILLRILAMYFVFLAFGASFQVFLEGIAPLQTDTVMGLELALYDGSNYFFAFLQYLANMLPYVLDVAVVLATLNLMKAMKENRYSQEVITWAHRVSRLCAVSLAATVLVTAALNLLQLLYLDRLRSVNIQVVIPVLSVAFVLTVLLVVQFIGENRQLKEDNDLFI